MYVTACTKIGRTGVVPHLHFPRVVRSIFNGSVGPNQIKIKQNNMETTGFYYEGIRIRAKPLPFVHKGTIVVSSNVFNMALVFLSEGIFSSLQNWLRVMVKYYFCISTKLNIHANLHIHIYIFTIYIHKSLILFLVYFVIYLDHSSLHFFFGRQNSCVVHIHWLKHT